MKNRKIFTGTQKSRGRVARTRAGPCFAPIYRTQQYFLRSFIFYHTAMERLPVSAAYFLVFTGF